MPINTVLAVVCVTDIDVAGAWYERLFGRPADLNPMGSLLEWQLSEGGWLQVFADADRAGSSFLTLDVDDLDAEITALTVRGLAPEEIPADPPMRLAQIKDPDDNMITFGQNLKGHE